VKPVEWKIPGGGGQTGKKKKTETLCGGYGYSLEPHIECF